MYNFDIYLEILLKKTPQYTMRPVSKTMYKIHKKKKKMCKSVIS